MAEAAQCPVCQMVLRSDLLGGLCPRCVWLGVEESAAGEASSPGPGLLAIPGHEVQEEIARGGMGIVYRAEQVEPRRVVALKMLLPGASSSAEMRERFRLEARAIASLEHPAILPVYQVGELDGLPFFTMKFAAGGTLTERRAEFTGNFRSIAELLVRLAGAVQFAHAHGILHRDLKPGNVLFDDAGSAYLSDFGLAKFTGEAATSESAVTRSLSTLGTPAYIAPEVARKGGREATIASDVYGLGAILYELLTGRPPFEATGLADLLRQITDEAPQPPSRFGRVPRDLEVICLQCLQKDPAHRYRSAAAFADDLRRWLDSRPIVARPPGAAERLWRWAERNPALATVSAVLLVALLAGSAALVLANRQLAQAVTESRAEKARAEEGQFKALVSEARALQFTRRRGQRFESLEAIRQAAKIRPDSFLRDEIAAALARPDLQQITNWPVSFYPDAARGAFLPDFSAWLEPGSSGRFRLTPVGSTNAIREFPGSPATFSFTADGEFMGTTQADGRAEAWEVATGRLVAQWTGSRTNLAVVALHPGQPVALARSPERGVHLCDLRDGNITPLAIPSEGIAALSIAPDGRHYGVLRSSSVELWTVSPLARICRHTVTSPAKWMAWSPDGAFMAVSSRADYSILILDPARRGAEITARLIGHRFSSTAGAFHPDGHTFFSIATDLTLRAWDFRTGDTLLVEPSGYAVLGLSPEGNRLGIIRERQQLALLEWAPQRGFHELRPWAGGSHSVFGLAVSRDGQLVASGDQRGIRVWDVQAGVQIGLIPQPLTSYEPIRWCADDRTVAFTESEGRVSFQPVTYHAGLKDQPAQLKLGERRRFDFGGATAVRRFLSDHATAVIIREKEAIELWRTTNDFPVARILHIPSPVTTYPDYSASLGQLVTADLSGSPLRVWDAQTGKLLKEVGEGPFSYPKFSPDSRWVVTSDPQSYQVWDTGSWTRHTTLAMNMGGRRFSDAAFTEHGSLLVTRERVDDLVVWKVPEFTRLVTLRAPRSLGLNYFTVAPDGSRIFLIGSGHRLYEWNLTELRREFARFGVDW